MKWKIGDLVSWDANSVIGAGTGRITKLYPGYTSSERDEDGNPIAVPEHVAVLVDVLPSPWPYRGTKTFAPEASRLRRP